MSQMSQKRKGGRTYPKIPLKRVAAVPTRVLRAPVRPNITPVKYRTGNANVITFAASSSWVINVVNVPEGTGPDEYVGNKFTWKSFEIRFTIESAPGVANPVTRYRFAVLYDKDGNGAGLTGTDIYNVNTFNGLRSPDSQDRFITLHDEIVPYDNGAVAGANSVYHAYVNINRFWKYNQNLFDSEGPATRYTAAGALVKGALIFACVPDRVVTATATGQFRANFYDKV